MPRLHYSPARTTAFDLPQVDSPLSGLAFCRGAGTRCADIDGAFRWNRWINKRRAAFSRRSGNFRRRLSIGQDVAHQSFHFQIRTYFDHGMDDPICWSGYSPKAVFSEDLGDVIALPHLFAPGAQPSSEDPFLGIHSH